MNKIKKYQLMQLLKEFELINCKTIEDIKKLLEQQLKDDDIVFQWKEYK